MGETVLTATFLINRTPSSVLNGKSPFEMIYDRKPDLHFLRVFACLCFATILNNFDKFSSRSEKCVLIGFSNVKKGYKLLSLDTKTILFSTNVKFYESIFHLKLIGNNSVVDEVENESGLNNTNILITYIKLSL